MFQVNGSRREFLADVGRGMLAGSLGLSAAADLGLLPASAAETGPDSTRLNFGPREQLVDLVQETPPDQLACSPKTEPDVMRVSEAEKANKERLDDDETREAE